MKKGPMQLREIDIERQEKILSILTDRIDYEQNIFWETVNNLNPPVSPRDRERLEAAVDFALNQDYGPGERNRFYGVHPLRVARFLAAFLDRDSSRFTDTLVAALVHNGIEKGILTESQLREQFGDWIAEAILTLTPDRKLTATEEGLRDYYQGIAALSPEVRTLKALDKFDNIFSLCLNPDDSVRRRYLQEIRNYVVPIVKADCPAIAPYFLDLVKNAEELGHYRPDFT